MTTAKIANTDTTANTEKKIKLTAREIKVQADVIAFREALKIRQNASEAFLESKDLKKVADIVLADNFSVILTNCLKEKLEYSHIIKCLPVSKKGENFIANKVLVKIIQLMQAVAGNAHKLDSYTCAVLFNLTKGINFMTVLEIQQSISKAVVNDNNAHRLYGQTRKVKNVKHSSIGTAGSQSSSSRMCLFYLNIADTVKGEKDAPLNILVDSNNGKAFLALADSLFSKHA